MDWIEQAHFNEITGIEKERENDRERAYRQGIVKGTKEFFKNYVLEDFSEQVRNVEIELLTTDIPRWKYGAKLKEKQSRDVFECAYAVVKASGGKYSKEANCWIFSSLKKRDGFIDNLRSYQQYPTPPKYTKASDFIDTDDLHFDFEGHYTTAKLKVALPDGKLYGNKIKDGSITFSYDSLEFFVEQMLYELNGWAK